MIPPVQVPSTVAPPPAPPPPVSPGPLSGVGQPVSYEYFAAPPIGNTEAALERAFERDRLEKIKRRHADDERQRDQRERNPRDRQQRRRRRTRMVRFSAPFLAQFIAQEVLSHLPNLVMIDRVLSRYRRNREWIKRGKNPQSPQMLKQAV